MSMLSKITLLFQLNGFLYENQIDNPLLGLKRYVVFFLYGAVFKYQCLNTFKYHGSGSDIENGKVRPLGS